MIKIILIFTTTILLSQTNFDNSFITKFEYGKMLYKNPRGISCVKCHGLDAKGRKIATFKYVRNKQTHSCSIISSDITKISYKSFIEKLDPEINKPKVKFGKDEICQKITYGNSMPTYFLTKEELSSIYYYLTHKDKNE